MVEKPIYNEFYEQRKPPEIVVGYEELHKCIDPVFEKLQSEGIQLTNDVTRFFENYSDKNGGGVLINDKEHKQIIGYDILESGNPDFEYELDETTLYVNDIEDFIRLLHELHKAIYSDDKPKAIDRSVSGQSLQNIWNNATFGDFQHPEIFVGRRINLIRDETLVKLQEWRPIGEVPVDGNTENFFVKHDSLPANYESPHDLRFAISDQDKPSEYDDLPAVRYGITEPGQATIYAIQMPRIGAKTEATYLAEIEKTKKGCLVTQTFFQNYLSSKETEGKSYFSDFPEELLDHDIDDYYEKFAKKLEAYLTKKAVEAGYDDYVVWAREKIAEKAVADALDDFDETMVFAEDQDSYAKELAKYHKRREILPRYTQAVKENSTNEFRGAPPTSLISLTAAVSLLHKQGIDEFLIPAYLPKRKHAEDDLDERIFNQTMQTVGRITSEVTGVEIAADPEEDGYYHLKITGDLTSKNPLLQGIITNAGKFEQ